MLHTVNKSPLDRNSFESCLNHAQAGHAILLIEDGIYAAVDGTTVTAKVKKSMKTVKFYALAPDVEARGMQSRMIAGVELVDYAGFVDLVTKHNPVQSWL